MPVQTEAGGRRRVDAAVEVPAGPAAAWDAVATGAGLSSWFVPTELEPRVGGAIVSHYGPGADSVGAVVQWEPPRRYVVRTAEEAGDVDTAWDVEPAGTGRSRIRVSHRWTAADDRWDAQFESHAHGWGAYFDILARYLEHYPGCRGASFRIIAATEEPVEHAWAAWTGPLCLFGVEAGDAVDVPEAPLAGTVVAVGSADTPSLTIRLDAPAPGFAHLVAHATDGGVYLTARFHLYGDGADAAAATARAAWQAWFDERYAAVGA